jgi:hypothetical protein
MLLKQLIIKTIKASNKRYRKSKVQSKMDNPNTLATLGTQDTKRRQTKTKKTKYNKENKKEEQHRPHQKSGVNPGALTRQAFA